MITFPNELVIACVDLIRKVQTNTILSLAHLGDQALHTNSLNFTLLVFQLKQLFSCCCRRKRFLLGMLKLVSPCMLLALRENESAMDVSSYKYDKCNSISKMLLASKFNNLLSGECKHRRVTGGMPIFLCGGSLNLPE